MEQSGSEPRSAFEYSLNGGFSTGIKLVKIAEILMLILGLLISKHGMQRT
jgi:hypothetical protein